MNTHKQKPASFTLLITIFALITVSIVIGAYLLLSFQKESVLRNAITELQFLGRLKKTQIEQWVRERDADARFISSNPSLAADFVRLIKNPSGTTRQATVDWMRAMVIDGPDLSVTAYRPDKTPMVTLPEGTLPPIVKAEPFGRASMSGQTVISDVATTGSGDFFFDTYVPILHPDKPKQVVGVVLLRLNLKKSFFPLVQAWPIPSETAEVLLVRRDRNSVLFLNELRFRGDAPLQLRIPLDSTHIPAVRAALGGDGIFEGIDYRGVQVISYMDKISGTPWRLIAKVDRSEALALIGDLNILFPIATVLAVLLVGSILTVIAVIRDTRERRTMQNELLQQTSLFRQLFENSPIAIALTDERDEVVDTNNAFLQIFGYTQGESLGKRLTDLIVPKSRLEESAALDVMVRKNVAFQKETVRMSKTGADVECLIHSFPVESEGKFVGNYILHTDLREQKRIERQFLRAQRMESIGTLAGGIAHDLNNVLGPILLSLGVLRRRISDEGGREILASIESSAKRGAGVIKQILSFARGGGGERVPVSIRHIIREISTLAQQTFSRSVTIQTFVQKDLWLLNADATQLHQVVMNLCLNARDAMQSGGTLTIKAENFIADEAFIQMQPQARPGLYVLLTVSDTGTGISIEDQGRIFDPFFTTKERGKGTGLGLSTVSGIVKSHEGFIDLVSNKDKGSEFKVYFPALDHGTESVDDEVVIALDGRGEKVIIVDDEKSIVAIMKSTLEERGYSVFTASDGAEAVGIVATHLQSIQIAIIDMMMPTMDGPNTIRTIRKLNPSIKILVISGMQFEEKSLKDQFAIQAFIQKPFTGPQLMHKIRSVLDGGSS